MKRKDLKVGEFYAYNDRPRMGFSPTKVEVIDNSPDLKTPKKRSWSSTSGGSPAVMVRFPGEPRPGYGIRQGEQLVRLSAIQSTWADHEAKVAAREAHDKKQAAAVAAEAAARADLAEGLKAIEGYGPGRVNEFHIRSFLRAGSSSLTLDLDADAFAAIAKVLAEAMPGPARVSVRADADLLRQILPALTEHLQSQEVRA